MPPVWKPAGAEFPENVLPSFDVAGLDLQACRGPRSPQPSAPETPNAALREIQADARGAPVPSKAPQRISEASTPPCRTNILDQPSDVVLRTP
jgi:hypothetical protein